MFAFEVTNQPPKMTGKIEDKYIAIDTVTTLQIPSINDPENMPVYISISVDAKAVKPKWITFVFDTFTFNPVSSGDKGAHVVNLQYTDGIARPVDVKFTVNILGTIIDVEEAEKKRN